MDGPTKWLRRAWRFTGAALVPTLLCALVLLLKDNGLLGGYRGAGTSLCVNVLVVTGPALLVGALLLIGVGLYALIKVGSGRGFGLSALAGCALAIVAVLGTLLGVGTAAYSH